MDPQFFVFNFAFCAPLCLGQNHACGHRDVRNSLVEIAQGLDHAVHHLLVCSKLILGFWLLLPSKLCELRLYVMLREGRPYHSDCVACHSSLNLNA